MLAAASTLGLTVLSAVPAYATTNPVYDKEWALSQFQVTQIRSQYHARGDGVTVAVIDSGVDPTQPDLQGSLLPGVNFSVPSNPTSDTNDRSSEYHGTSVAADIAAHAHGDSSNPQGMYGLATQAKILPLVDGTETTTAVADATAIRYAADHGSRVINVSGGVPGACTSDEAAAIDYALSKNVVIVAAGGNSGKSGNAPVCPADHPGVIDVSAIDQSGHMDQYSHYGDDVTVAAPGVGIEVPYPNGQYGMRSGTSQAAPWVSAEAALIIGLHPDWTAGQVVRVIIDNTVQATGQRIDAHVGYGVIDPLKALGAPAPTDTSNPLGGPAAASAAPSASAGTGNAPSNAASTAAAASSSKSSNIGLYAGLGVAVLVLIGVIVFLITRGRNNNGSGSGGGGGGGGGNGYYPPTPTPGGHYAQPGQEPQQYPSSTSSQPYSQQGSGAQYPPPGSPYSPPSSPYGQQQQQQQQPGQYGQPGQAPQGQTPWPQQ